MTISYLFLADGGFLVGDSVAGSTNFAAAGSAWAERARKDPEGVASEMIENTGPASHPADPRGQ